MTDTYDPKAVPTLDPLEALQNLAEFVRETSVKPDENVDLIEAERILRQHEQAKTVDVGRLDVPSSARDRVLTIRNRANAVFRSVGDVWSTETKIASAKDDLMRIAEEALAARRTLQDAGL